MNCESLALLLNAVLDGELTDVERSLVDRHLENCASCRQELMHLQEFHAGLLRQLRPPMAEPVIQRVMTAITVPNVSTPNRPLPESPATRQRASEWHPDRLTKSPPKHRVRSRRGTIVLLLGTVLAAILVMSNLAHRDPAVAEITLATGSVEIRSARGANWNAVAGPTGVRLTAHSRVRTRDWTLCEIRTSANAVVRMNHGTELIFHDSKQIELVAGEFYCRTPSTAAVEILNATTRSTAAETKYTCPSSSETQWQASAESGIECVAVSETPIQLTVEPPAAESQLTSCTVNPGQGMIFSAHSPPQPSYHNQLQEMSWQLPLLLLRRPSDEELQQRLTQLLAQLGESKMSFMYDQQIRELGPAGTIPLIAFIRTTSVSERPELRRRAMQIVADLAPASSIRDLRVLAQDDDPLIRQLAAKAIDRLDLISKEKS